MGNCFTSQAGARRTALVVTLIVVFSARSALSQSCDVKEYAQYKDDAATMAGRISLAFAYCAATSQRESASKLHLLAAQYGHAADLAQASRAIELCSRERTKIADALQAQKAFKAIEFARGGCKDAGDPTWAR